MTRIKPHITGGFVDESVRPRAVERTREIGGDDDTVAQIGEALGHYRLVAQYRDTAPKNSDAINHLLKMENGITALLSDIDLAPEYFTAKSSEVLWKLNREVYEDLERPLKETLCRYRALCNWIAEEWGKGRDGERPKTSELRLLATTHKIVLPLFTGRGRKGRAAVTAAIILTDAGVPYIYSADSVTLLEQIRVHS